MGVQVVPWPCVLPRPLPPGPLGPPSGLHQARLPRKRRLGARAFFPPQKSQQPPQEALLRKMQDSRDMLKCTDRFRDVSGHGRGRPLCEGAEGWACPRICGSQACPDLAFRRPSALGLASLLASAITVRCYSSEKEVSAGPSHAFLTSTTGDGPLAASPRVAYPPIILLSLPPPILAA